MAITTGSAPTAGFAPTFRPTLASTRLATTSTSTLPGSVTDRLTQTTTSARLAELARNIADRLITFGKQYVAKPIKTALPYLDNGAHEIGWALKGAPPLRIITATLAAIFKIASVVFNLLNMALAYARKKEDPADLDSVTNARNWPDYLRLTVEPLILILNGAKKAADWVVGVLDPSGRPDWSTNPVEHFERTINKVMQVSVEDLKVAANRSLDLPVTCLITDIANALKTVDSQRQEHFNHHLVDQILGNLEKKAKGDIDKLHRYRENLLSLSETCEATPLEERSKFHGKDSALAAKLMGKPTSFKHVQGSDVFASYTIAPTIIWNAVGTFSRPEFTHL